MKRNVLYNSNSVTSDMSNILNTNTASPETSCVSAHNNFFKKHFSYRSLFVMLSILAFAVYLFTGIQGNASGDSFWDGAHGKYALKYYLEGDTTIIKQKFLKLHHNANICYNTLLQRRSCNSRNI
jgi:hypothetical protein